ILFKFLFFFFFFNFFLKIFFFYSMFYYLNWVFLWVLWCWGVLVCCYVCGGWLGFFLFGCFYFRVLMVCFLPGVLFYWGFFFLPVFNGVAPADILNWGDIKIQ
ncbi:hypothetical protein ACNIRO_25105, partial [Escherichia coli]